MNRIVIPFFTQKEPAEKLILNKFKLNTELLRAMKTVHADQDLAFYMLMLFKIGQKESEQNELIVLISNLSQKIFSKKILKTFMELENLTAVNIHGECSFCLFDKGVITYGETLHDYPQPHTSALLTFAGFLGLKAKFDGYEKLPFQQVKLTEL